MEDRRISITVISNSPGSQRRPAPTGSPGPNNNNAFTMPLGYQLDLPGDSASEWEVALQSAQIGCDDQVDNSNLYVLSDLVVPNVQVGENQIALAKDLLGVFSEPAVFDGNATNTVNFTEFSSVHVWKRLNSLSFSTIDIEVRQRDGSTPLVASQIPSTFTFILRHLSRS